jgi:hypothetical protein
MSYRGWDLQRNPSPSSTDSASYISEKSLTFPASSPASARKIQQTPASSTSLISLKFELSNENTHRPRIKIQCQSTLNVQRIIKNTIQRPPCYLCFSQWHIYKNTDSLCLSLSVCTIIYIYLYLLFLSSPWGFNIILLLFIYLKFCLFVYLGLLWVKARGIYGAFNACSAHLLSRTLFNILLLFLFQTRVLCISKRQPFLFLLFFRAN